MKNYRYIERRNRLIKTIVLWAGEVLGILLLAWLLVHYCVQVIEVHGNSMQTAYYDGDLILVNKLRYRTHDPERYDAVVFELENGTATHYTLKRIVGLPGEKILISNGELYVNDERQDYYQDEIMSAGLAAYEIVLGEDEYFVMGDNCNNSEDSRVANIGNIHRAQLTGRAGMILFKSRR